MTQPETRRILLITSCPECGAVVANALTEQSPNSKAEPGYAVHTLPMESVVASGLRHDAFEKCGPVDVVLIDWSDSIGVQIVQRLANAAFHTRQPLFVVLSDDGEALAASIESRLPGTHALSLPRRFDPCLLRQAIRAACAIGRMQTSMGNREMASDRLGLRAAEIERRAEDLERWKKEFLANVSHELRTPMNAILGYSRLLLNEQMASRHHRQVGEIHDAGNNLLDLINNIIDFTKLSGGEIRLAKTPFRVRDVATELVEHYRPAAEHKGLRLECHVPSDVPTLLRGDKHRYRQVLAGLLSNAVKFTERGGIDVRLATDETIDNQITLRTVVTDTGVGIASDREEAVFREFSQGDGSTTRSFGGLGLGLAVAKRLVDLMGGQVGFRSVVGDGTSFWVALPFERIGKSDNPALEAPVDQYLAGTDGPAPNNTGRRRILAVDGDATQRMLIEAFLSRTGCLVDAVSSADDAVAAAKGLIYDLAFIEIRDPSTDGVEAIRRVRGVLRERGQHTPIVAVGHGLSSAHRKAVIDAGANGLLAKPFDIPDLVTTVGRYLPLAVEPLLEAGAAFERADERDMDDDTCWSDQMDDVRRAFAAADYTCLEARTGALRRRAIKQGSRAAADGAMRLQVAVRSGDGHRITLALERLDRIICATRDAETTRRTQLQTC